MDAKHTPLYDTHVAHGGKMTEFCGYMLPVQYAGIITEHEAVRKQAGLFDVSHMGRLELSGMNAAALLQRLTTNDISEMKPGRIRYSFMCNEGGGVKDDILIYCMGDGAYRLVVNASNHEKIVEHIHAHMVPGVTFFDRTDQTGHIALQGPMAQQLIATVCDVAELPTAYYTFADNVAVAGCACFVSRNGYTGEDGYEIICAADDTPAVYEALLGAGAVQPCGLGCRDTLRFEAGMPLYGHELNEDITPFEAGLGMFVRPVQGPFVGKEALEQQIAEGVARKRIGLVMLDRGIPRQGFDVYCNGALAGIVTSGSYCPSLEQNCAMALVDTKYVGEKEFEIEIRGKRLDCEAHKLPFYKAKSH